MSSTFARRSFSVDLRRRENVFSAEIQQILQETWYHVAAHQFPHGVWKI
jgi:hypothetical protein